MGGKGNTAGKPVREAEVEERAGVRVLIAFDMNIEIASENQRDGEGGDRVEDLGELVEEGGGNRASSVEEE